MDILGRESDILQCFFHFSRPDGIHGVRAAAAPEDPPVLHIVDLAKALEAKRTPREDLLESIRVLSM